MESATTDAAPPDPTGEWSGTVLVARDGQVVHEESRGSLDGPGSEPCGPRTRFQASSISKQFVAVVALALAERGALDVTDPVARWLPDLPPAFAGITLHHLLTHTSGLGHWGELGVDVVVPPDPATLRALTVAAGPSTPAGSAWRYSGPGFLLAVETLEAATGRRYRDLLTEFVLVPAATRATTSGEFPLGRPGTAAGHRAGRRVHVDAGWTRIAGSGDLWTTAEDLLACSRALRSGRLLDPGTAALVWTAHVALPPEQGLTAADAYGYGTFLGRVRGRPAWFVPGDNPGYQSLLAHLRDDGTDLVVLSNDEDPGTAPAVRRAPLA